MKALRFCVISFCATLLCVLSVAVHASPLAEAEDQARAAFRWPESQLSSADQAWVERPWAAAPLDAARYTYTFAEIQQKWPQLMRGMQLDFPSADYLRSRYLKFPGLLQSLEYQDADWQQHSYNVLETWQAFFRGDYQHAYQLGKKYGGYAQVPGVLSEIIQAIYLTRSLSEKQALLRDAVLQIHHYGQQFPIVPGDKDYSHDYAMLRLGFAYAVGRLAEDEPVPALLTNKHPIIAINAVTELLSVMPDHPMGLALAGGVDANVIRRVGKLVGRIGLDVRSFDAEKAFVRSIDLVPDMAILRYEFANSMLYAKGRDAWPEAQQQLLDATEAESLTVMEALDVAYAKKHLSQLDIWASGAQTYKDFDAAQRKMRVARDINGYSLVPVSSDEQAALNVTVSP